MRRVTAAAVIKRRAAISRATVPPSALDTQGIAATVGTRDRDVRLAIDRRAIAPRVRSAASLSAPIVASHREPTDASPCA